MKMLCPKCKTELPVGARFCFNCGAPQAIYCAKCGTELPDQARFCPNCGSPTTKSQPASSSEQPVDPELDRIQRLIPKEYLNRLLATRGKVERERRLVTILFADIKESTAMSEMLDPEEVLEIMSGAFEALIAPIYRHEGTLARLMGDAILAFFGAPIAHEDDPERAVQAALEIIESIKAYATKLEQERGLHGFNVRVGINTGQVVVGEVGSDLRVEYTAMGDAINLASRIEQNAPVGGVLITQETYQNLRGLFDVQAQPPLIVKGKSEPVQTYVVHGIRPHTFRAGGRGIAGVETPMVGRINELKNLQSAFQDLMSQTAPSACLTLIGEAGVGKSRLLFEFESWLRRQPGEYEVLRGRAVSIQQHTPYSLLRDIFQERFKILENDSPAQVHQKFESGMHPQIETAAAQLVGNLLGLGFEDTPAVKNLKGSSALVTQARANLLTYFRTLAFQAPLLIFMEDLHWADDTTLDFIESLFDVEQDSEQSPNLLLIALTRPSFFERRPNWGKQRNWQRLNLQPLSETHSHQLVDIILSRLIEPPQQLRQLIVERAEGNPFYLEELVMMLIGDGIIVCDPAQPGQSARWHIEPERMKELRVPSTLVGVLQARLDSLPDEEKELLQRASVIGRRFWDIPLEALSCNEIITAPGALLDTLNAQVARLSERQIIFPQPHSAFDNAHEYSFKHAILHDVVYETVLLKLRRLYHHLVAEWLEANSGERVGEYAEQIATHYEQANENEKAFEWLHRAAMIAIKACAYRDALTLLQRADTRLPAESSTQRAALLARMGFVFMRLGDMTQSGQYLEQTIDIATRSGDWALLAKAQKDLSFVVFTTGDKAKAGKLAAASLEAARKAGEDEALAHALMAFSEFEETEEAAERTLRESLELFRKIGERGGEATCLLNIGNFYYEIHKYVEARQVYEESLEIYRQINNRWGIANDLANLGCIHTQLGDKDKAIQLYEEAIQIERELGDRESLSIALMDIGSIYYEREQEETALSYLYQGLVEAQAAQVAIIKQMTLVYLAGIACRHEDFEHAAWLLGPLQEKRIIDEDSWENEAKPILDKLQIALPDAQLDMALSKGHLMQVDGVVEALLAEPPAPGKNSMR